MSDCVVKYAVSASPDSAIIVELLHTKLLKKHKYVLSFDDFSGELYYVQNHPEQSRLTLNVTPQSITCKDRRLKADKQRHIAKRANDLVRSAAVPPTIQFSSKQFSAKPLRGFAVEGALTVNGVVRPVKMNAVFSPPAAHHLEVEGDFLFQFSAFGIKTPSSLLGMSKIADQALVQFHFQAVQAS